jgi:predicted O-methyltransferase YrrM
MPEFTSDWFSHNIPHWQRHVIEKLPAGPIHWLELGAFEGRSACWVHDNVIVPRGGSLSCLDSWWKDDYEQRFDANMAGKTIEKIKSRTHPWLMQNQGKRTFHVVYVDADHEAKSVLLDAALAWPMLETGGFMIFDDYVWQHPEPKGKVPPKVGIDAFIACWQHQLVVCHKGYQLIVRKI